MSHSKGTTNYNLPLFTKDARPAWLTDFNSAMLGVDASLKAVADSVEAGGLPVTGGTMQGNIDMGNLSMWVVGIEKRSTIKRLAAARTAYTLMGWLVIFMLTII